ncbi:MAG: YggS family pyridoxal phosphate-dependent enzyme [Clostridiales bacterium]|nr:YggS family pyridoxal phosphate-dependent enzyme [Clostridiales bacterium]MDD7035431.1 YggS family pyridoxal phosphate-dependent enzyme [Bacillota bacterium]MDY2919993.1 YggS family pyridoxal phosphate-dependent enzyme [Lentihominibacter sp.]
MEDIKKNLEKVHDSIREAAEACGRSEDEVLLVAVSKTRTPEEINTAIDAGTTDIGENKVQEIMDKYDAVKPVRWHMIGHLQTNKVKYIIDKVDMIHSVDSMKLAHEIDKRAGAHGKVMDILVQINPAQEESKFGVSIEDAGDLVREILDSCENIRVRGLMSVAPIAENPMDVKPYFDGVKAKYDELSKIDHPRLDFRYLSMGMSHDFPVAIAAGSNLVRVGSAIFGERDYAKFRAEQEAKKNGNA